jgi:hypothetical protein
MKIPRLIGASNALSADSGTAYSAGWQDAHGQLPRGDGGRQTRAEDHLEVAGRPAAVRRCSYASIMRCSRVPRPVSHARSPAGRVARADALELAHQRVRHPGTAAAAVDIHDRFDQPGVHHRIAKLRHVGELD